MEKGGFLFSYIQYGTEKELFLDIDYNIKNGVLSNGNIERIIHFEIKPTNRPLPSWLNVREFAISVEYAKSKRIVNFADIPGVDNPDTAFLIASCYYEAINIIDWNGE